jgi:hypothetical protein
VTQTPNHCPTCDSPLVLAQIVLNSRFIAVPICRNGHSTGRLNNSFSEPSVVKAALV